VLREDLPRLRRIVRSNEFRSAQVAGMSTKEIEAEAFAIYAAGKSTVKPHTLVGAAWDRIVTLMRRIANFARGHGFQVAEDIFEQALAGRISARAAAAPGDGLRQFAAAWRNAPAEYAAGGTPKLRSKGFPADTKVIGSWRNTRTIVAHADYAAAKAGDTEAAARLIPDVVKPETVEEAAAAFGDDVTYVPVLAIEQSGHNRIPAMMAAFHAARTGASVERRIYQANRAFHTGAKAAERLATRLIPIATPPHPLTPQTPSALRRRSG